MVVTGAIVDRIDELLRTCISVARAARAMNAASAIRRRDMSMEIPPEQCGLGAKHTGIIFGEGMRCHAVPGTVACLIR